MATSREIAERFGLDPTARSQEIPDFDRQGFASLLGDLGYRVGVEIGVERGIHAKSLCQRITGLRLYCVDPWEAYGDYREHVTQSKLDGFHEETCDRLATYDVEVVREFSVPAAERFEKESLDFVYIDGNHELSNVIADLTAWAPKVRKGGIVAGHDYIRLRRTRYLMHVVSAVHAYVEAWEIRPLFIVGRKHPDPGEARDGNRTWFWVVE